VKRKLRWIASIIIWLIAVYMFSSPFEGLSMTGHFVIAGLLIALPLWIWTPGGIPRSVAGLFILGIVLIGYGPRAHNGLAGFTSPAFWALLSGSFYALVLIKTGLATRIASFLLKVFKPTRLGVTLALIVTGLVLSGLVPSIVLRIAILLPIALGLKELLKLEDRSPSAAFLTLLALTMALIPGNGWYIGEGWYTLGVWASEDIFLLLYPIDIVQTITLNWGDWAQAMVVPFVLLTIFLIFSLFIATRPQSFPPIEKSKSGVANLDPMSRDEKISAVVLGLSLIGFVISPFIDIFPAAISLIGVMVLFALRVIRFAEISAGINWDLIIFFGVVLSLGRALSSGFPDWLEPHVEPFLENIASNVYVFVVVVILILMALRFVDVALGIGAGAILLSLTPMLYTDFGIHPLVVTCLASIAGMFFFLHYMNPLALMGDTLLEGRGWAQGHLVKYGIGFVVSALLAVVISVFYWQAINLIE
jgi:di/tricarboxylate transporter